MQFLSLHGKNIIPHLKDIAELRIAVFREFPYLYDGDIHYEMNYLQAYVNSPHSLILLIKDGDRAIGATSALPLAHADTEFHAPFIKHSINLSNVYYFGESVLLPAYRGRHYGHHFFDERERYALELGFSITAFCAVQRDTQDPLRPANYVGHDVFWTKRGYQKHEGFSCFYRWKDINEAEASDKLMQFWLKHW